MDEGSAVLGGVVLVALLAGIVLAVFLASVNDKLGRIADALEEVAGIDPPEEPGDPRPRD